MALLLLLILDTHVRQGAVVGSPHLHGVEELAEVIEESTTSRCAAAFGEFLRMLLKLRDLGLVNIAKSVIVEIIFLQPAPHLLVSTAAHTEDGKVAGDFFIVSHVFVGVEGVFVLLDGGFLIQPAAVSMMCVSSSIGSPKTHSLMPMANPVEWRPWSIRSCPGYRRP